MILLALAAGAMMITSCKKNGNNEPAVNEFYQNYTKMIAYTGQLADTVEAQLKADGYAKDGTAYTKVVNSLTYTMELDRNAKGIVLEEKLRIEAKDNNSFISKDADFINQLESMTAYYMLASKDTASFFSFGCDSYGSGGVDGFADMVAGHRQAMMDARVAQATWDNGKSYDAYRKNYVQIKREFHEASRATGGLVTFTYRNENIMLKKLDTYGAVI